MRLVVVVAAIAAHGAAAQTLEVDGSGTTNPSKFFWHIMDSFMAMTRRDIRLTYRAVGSSTGQREFTQSSDNDYTAGLTDFGSGDIPMTNARWQGLQTAGRGAVHVPFALGAIGIFHSVPEGEVGAQGLKLKPCVLAKIFSGAITEWTDPEIAVDNPGMAGIPAGTKIQVGHRNLGSSSTSGVSGYLVAATAAAGCTTDWTLGSGSTLTWPTAPTHTNFHPVEGSGGMTTHIASTKYAIGYIDAGHGHQRGFSEVHLQNPAGTWLTSKMAMESGASPAQNGIAAAGAQAVTAGTIPADAAADWSAVNLYNQGGSDTWPIVLVSYIYVTTDMSSWSVDKASLLKAFVDYVTDATKGQALLAEYSFNPVPSQMNTWATVWSSKITKPAGYADVFSFEDSTNAWTGQGLNVISVKRNTYSLWRAHELELANEALEARVQALEQHLDDFGVVPLHGSGTTNPRNWFAQVMKQMEHRARAPLLLTYRAVGSSTGQKEFTGQASSGWASYNHFGAGDIPMTQERFDSMAAQGITMLHLPFALSAIGIFHSVPAGELGSASLQLPDCLLARSSSTTGLTSYLKQKCEGNGWTLGSGSTVTWPTSSGFTPVQGSQGMQQHISDTPYAIGYLDAGHGHQYGFGEIALKNKAGRTRTSKESMALSPSGVQEAGTQGVNSGTFPSLPNVDWSAVNLYDMEGDNTWPIVLVSYLYVRKDQTKTNPKTSSTAAYTGMGDNIISVKRTAFDDYQRDLLFKEVDAMKSQLAQLAQPAPQVGDNDDDEGSTGTAALAVAIIAAVLAAMALLVGCFAYSKGRSAAAGASGTMLGRPEASTNS
ncbi:pstS [Symbiodinium microadriaticum]|nr:pstS [Symbiodinium microadriaticum]